MIALAALLATLVLLTSPRGPVCPGDQFRAATLDAYQAVGSYLVERAC